MAKFHQMDLSRPVFHRCSSIRSKMILLSSSSQLEHLSSCMLACLCVLEKSLYLCFLVEN
nr:MAG TPA: hypothetical protein [Caudoviricetes sp.]